MGADCRWLSKSNDRYYDVKIRKVVRARAQAIAAAIYIYVAFGEHPAAGGLYVFFVTLGSNLMFQYHFGWPCGVFFAL